MRVSSLGIQHAQQQPKRYKQEVVSALEWQFLSCWSRGRHKKWAIVSETGENKRDLPRATAAVAAAGGMHSKGAEARPGIAQRQWSYTEHPAQSSLLHELFATGSPKEELRKPRRQAVSPAGHARRFMV